MIWYWGGGLNIRPFEILKKFYLTKMTCSGYFSVLQQCCSCGLGIKYVPKEWRTIQTNIKVVHSKCVCLQARPIWTCSPNHVWHTATLVWEETVRASSHLRDLPLSFLHCTSNTGTQMGNYAPSLVVQLAKSKRYSVQYETKYPNTEPVSGLEMFPWMYSQEEWYPQQSQTDHSEYFQTFNHSKML
jgi:hypothetical protein